MRILMALAALAASDAVPMDPGWRPASMATRRPPAAGIELWTDADLVLHRGARVTVFFRTHEDAYVTVFRVDTDGSIRVLFPATPWRNNYARRGRDYRIAPVSRRFTFEVDDYPGQGLLFAVASTTPFRYTRFLEADRWDLARLVPEGRIIGEPESALRGLAEAILPEPTNVYAYDFRPYHVGRRYGYPRFVCYDCHVAAPFPTWNPYRDRCPRYPATPAPAGGGGLVPVEPGHPDLWRGTTRPPDSVAAADTLPGRRRPSLTRRTPKNPRRPG